MMPFFFPPPSRHSHSPLPEPPSPLRRRQVYDLETSYLNDSSQHGNVLKGFEGFLSQTKNTTQKKARNFKPEDRMFSLSSATSPVVDEIAAEKAEEKTVTTQSGRKAGGGGGYR